MFPELRQAVLDAAPRAEVHQAIQRIYTELQAEIDRRQPLCSLSGRCCRFEEFGHRLYITTMELAAFLRDFPPVESLPEPLRRSLATWDNTGCPFQLARLCGLHTIRPFGCRIFFCDPTATLWQNDLYERFHSQLKRLHESLAVPYFYVEWRDALRAILPPNLTPNPSSLTSD
ncbi:MAG: hypothetical protein ACM359_01090 [Bacillota bacterium]